MLKVLWICCFLLFAVTAADFPSSRDNEVVEKVKSDIHFVENIGEARQLFPNTELTPLTRSKDIRGSIRYILGNRVSGDRIVAQGGDYYQWATLQDVTLNLRYPQNGNGAVVTFVEILVGQSSNIGQAYLVAGGIGQRFISIVIEARSTSWFSYNASFFGY